MSASPHQKPDKDTFSDIGPFRLALGLTLREVATMARTSLTTIVGLNSGVISPLYAVGEKSGKLKPCVPRLARALGVTVEELFPKYVEELENNMLNEIDINRVSCGNKEIPTPEALLERRQFLDRIKERLGADDWEIIYYRFYQGYTYAEVGRIRDLSRERIRQIELRALNRIRHSLKANRYDTVDTDIWKINADRDPAGDHKYGKRGPQKNRFIRKGYYD